MEATSSGENPLQFFMERSRPLKGLARWLYLVLPSLGIIVVLLQMTYNVKIFGFRMFPYEIMAIFMSLLFSVSFLVNPATRKSQPKPGVPWYDWLLATLVFAGGVYIAVFGYQIEVQGWELQPPLHAIILGTLYALAVIEGCRRSVGMVFTVIATIFMTYPIVAQFIPGFLTSLPISFKRLIGYTFLSQNSLFGLGAQALAGLMFTFFLLVAVMMYSGAGRFFIRLGLALVGRFPGGAAKVSIISSMLFGSITGAASYNVLMTGVVTIPAMKKSGYSPNYAGAVEAVASSGSALMPPIMGMTAFLMAQFLGVDYGHIIVLAVIPSFFYYYGIFMQSHLEALARGIKGMTSAELPRLFQVLKEGWIYLLVLGVLVINLLYLRMGVKAPILPIFILLGYVVITTWWKGGWRTAGRILLQTIEGAVQLQLQFIAVLLAIGAIAGAIDITGVAQGFSGLVAQAAMGNVYLVMLYGAIMSFFLGMGMVAPIAYIFLALLVAPAMIKGGLEIFSVHFFIMYTGLWSNITPPVAIAALFGARIAGGDYIKTGWLACRLGFTMMVFPFLFIAEPSLLGLGSAAQIMSNFFLAAVAMTYMTAAMQGYFFWLGKLPWIARLLLIASAALIAVNMLIPAWPTWHITSLFGLVLGVSTLGLQLLLGSGLRSSPGL